ncbi:MAG: DMT family transporter [Sulfolobales archaeon]
MVLSKAIQYALIVVAWLSISSASIIVVLSRATALACAFWRLFIAALLIALYSLFKGLKDFYLEDIKYISLSILSGIFLATHFLTWMESLFYIPISLSTTIVVLYPLIAMLYETVLRISRPRWSELIGVLVAFCGTVVAVRPYLVEKALYGSILAFSGAITGAAYFTVGRYLRKKGVGLASYTLVCYSTSTIFLFAYSVVTKQSIIPGELNAWVYLVLLALIPMLGGHTVINYLVKYMKSYVATVIGFGEAPGATILASLILSQDVSLNVLIGMAITMLGALYTIREGVKQ